MVRFGMRTVLEQYNLIWGDITLQTDPDSGIEFLLYDTEWCTNTKSDADI